MSRSKDSEVLVHMLQTREEKDSGRGAGAPTTGEPNSLRGLPTSIMNHMLSLAGQDEHVKIGRT